MMNNLFLQNTFLDTDCGTNVSNRNLLNFNHEKIFKASQSQG